MHTNITLISNFGPVSFEHAHHQRHKSKIALLCDDRAHLSPVVSRVQGIQDALTDYRLLYVWLKNGQIVKNFCVSVEQLLLTVSTENLVIAIYLVYSGLVKDQLWP